MKRNMYNWLQELSGFGNNNSLPLITYPGLELSGKKISEVIANGKDQFECIQALANKYPTAATVTIMDLSAEAEAFGSNIRFSDHEVPTVIGSIINDQEAAEKLQVPEVGAARTGAYLETCRLAAKGIVDRPVFGVHIGPFSLAGRLMDMTEIMIAMMEEPEIVHIVLEKCTHFLVEYAKAFKATGVNGIIIAEPAAGLLSPLKCHEFSSKYVKQIVDAVQDENFIVILHNCGNTVKLIDTLLSTGSRAFHFGNAVNMTDILPQIPKDRVAFGNIDPSSIFKNGTTEDVKNAVTKLLEDMKPYDNFVLSSGCDVPPGTPLENLDMFFDTFASFNKSGNLAVL
ncbi:MAG: methylcobamide--CoM methyltransferase [Clostridiales bacterium]|nr:methylcobamide--CoM methyltransferase [Clostridiales bacterium]